jgi:hypothetical protein
VIRERCAVPDDDASRDVKVIPLSEEDTRAIRSILSSNQDIDSEYRILILVDPPGVCIPWN